MKHFIEVDCRKWIDPNVASRLTEKPLEIQIERVAKEYKFDPTSFSKIVRGIRPYNLKNKDFKRFQKAVSALLKLVEFGASR